MRGCSWGVIFNFNAPQGAAQDGHFSSVMARLEPEQLAQMEALRGALMDAILAENAARTTKPKGEPNHDKDL